ncbi:MAG: hypothetical protein KF869_14040 [Phycisphaeraceae bacterium]|nr:hypothetical protein [Phycisphaeraceae bacterium]
MNICVSALVAGLVVAAAWGVQPGTRPVDSRGLKRLDQGYEDIDPLRASLRMQPVDLRMPLDFDAVYSLPGRGATDRLVRMSGALAAVFPRSEYVAMERGVRVLVPANTVFYIGSLPAGEEEAPRVVAPGSAAARADLGRADSAADGLARTQDVSIAAFANDAGAKSDARAALRAPATAGRGIMNDEGYRAARVRQLLETAASANPTTR